MKHRIHSEPEEVRKRLGSMFADLGKGKRFTKKERAEFALMAAAWLASVKPDPGRKKKRREPR